MRYILKHKNIALALFDYSNNSIVHLLLNKDSVEMLPLPVKLILRADNIETEKENIIVADEEGCLKFDVWLSDRAVPVGRANYEKYLSEPKEGIEWLLQNSCFSFTDCYYTVKVDNDLSWEEIRDSFSKLDELITIENNSNSPNFRYKGHNSALGGQLEKYWFNNDNKLYLCKKNEERYEILSIREVIASMIYKRQGFSACDYKLIKKNDAVTGCICASFVNDDKIEFVSAFDLLQEYALSQDNNVYEMIIKLAALKGCSEEEVSRYMDMMVLVDYLINNRDRHEGNIGFLRDSDTLKIISPVPVYDSGSSLKMEGSMPCNSNDMSVNGLYPTQQECLRHVKDFSVLNLALLPTAEEIRNVLNEGKFISEEKKEEFLMFYEKRKAFIKEMQSDNGKSLPPVDKDGIDRENAMNLFRVCYKGKMKRQLNDAQSTILELKYNDYVMSIDFDECTIKISDAENYVSKTEIVDAGAKREINSAQKQLKEFLKEYGYEWMDRHFK